MTENRRMNDLHYAFDAYLGDLARAGRTPATRLKYQQILWAFADTIDERDCDRITPDHCRRFLDRWVNATPSTQALSWTILNGFFGFLVAETVIDENPMARIPVISHDSGLRDAFDHVIEIGDLDEPGSPERVAA